MTPHDVRCSGLFAGSPYPASKHISLSIHAPVMLLTDLDTDLLLSVCNLLDPCSLAGLGCVSRRLRSVVRAPELWEPCCRSRWRHLRAELYQQPASGDASAVSPNAPDGATLASPADYTNWRSLYDGGNGWRNPSFSLRQIPIDAECDFVSAIACAARGDHITVATSHSIEAWDPGDIQARQIQQFSQPCAWLSSQTIRTMLSSSG